MNISEVKYDYRLWMPWHVHYRQRHILVQFIVLTESVSFPDLIDKIYPREMVHFYRHLTPQNRDHILNLFTIGLSDWEVFFYRQINWSKCICSSFLDKLVVRKNFKMPSLTCDLWKIVILKCIKIEKTITTCGYVCSTVRRGALLLLLLCVLSHCPSVWLFPDYLENDSTDSDKNSD